MNRLESMSIEINSLMQDYQVHIPFRPGTPMAMLGKQMTYVERQYHAF